MSHVQYAQQIFGQDCVVKNVEIIHMRLANNYNDEPVIMAMGVHKNRNLTNHTFYNPVVDWYGFFINAGNSDDIQVHANGGYTACVVTVEKNGNVAKFFGLSICSLKDSFNRKTGRERAIQRAHHAYKHSTNLCLPAAKSAYSRLAISDAVGKLNPSFFLTKEI